MSWFTLEDEDSCGGASISGTSNGGATFFCQTRLSFEFDFGLIGPSFLTRSSSGSKLSLVEFGRSAPPHLLEVCFAHNDKVEIKCMGSVGGKTPTEPKLYIFSFLALGTLNHDKVDVMCIVLSSYLGDRIRRMSMNVAF
jgi:hypothetical protein